MHHRQLPPFARLLSYALGIALGHFLSAQAPDAADPSEGLPELARLASAPALAR